MAVTPEDVLEQGEEPMLIRRNLNDLYTVGLATSVMQLGWPHRTPITADHAGWLQRQHTCFTAFDTGGPVGQPHSLPVQRQQQPSLRSHFESSQ